jgi:hypothetical protein
MGQQHDRHQHAPNQGPQHDALLADRSGAHNLSRRPADYK